MNDFNMVRVAVNSEVERRVGPVLDRYARQLSAQQGIVTRARFLSPAILMQDALNDIAGTGTARHREFVKQVEVYHQRWRDYFIPLVFRRRGCWITRECRDLRTWRKRSAAWRGAWQ
jgi:ABC-2 type transport system permease protein